MSDLIERNKAIEAVQRCCPDTSMYRAIRDIPSVEPKRGHWIDTEIDSGEVYPIKVATCSVCGEWTHIKGYPFCPNCGAKMDGERKDQ